MAEANLPPAVDLTVLAQGAVAMHELRRSLLDAGFNQYEALWLTAALAGGLRPPPGWDKPAEDHL